MSQFAWLDYSEHERRKMLDIVDLFREHDTRDELGIGSVRDTFADLFFPGTFHDYDTCPVFSACVVDISAARKAACRIGANQ